MKIKEEGADKSAYFALGITKSFIKDYCPEIIVDGTLPVYDAIKSVADQTGYPHEIKISDKVGKSLSGLVSHIIKVYVPNRDKNATLN